ncbi:MAG TPA: hypothetical protein VGG37_00765, partial [Opitutaceae bacterium]
LRRAGVPVTLFEAGGYPRHRVCGEFIAGLEKATVDALGIGPQLADAVPHDSVTYFVRGRALPPFRLPGTAWGISRHALDARMARAFVEAGGHLLTHTRAPEDETPPGRIFAAGRRRSGPHWVGLKAHVRGLRLENDFEVHLGERCYVGLSRTEAGEVNACGLFAPKAVAGKGLGLLLGYLESCGLSTLSDRIRAADADPESVCVTAASPGDREIRPADRIWIGDACASIAPFTGNGLAMALQGALVASGPLAAYASGKAGWAETVRLVGRAQRRRFRRRLLVSSALHPFLLEPRRQALLAAAASMNLIPFRALHSAVH